jgi:hypothetical protein
MEKVLASEVAPTREQRLRDALYLEECALAVLEGRVDRGIDPSRDSYISGCKTILKSWRAALEAK